MGLLCLLMGLLPLFIGLFPGKKIVPFLGCSLSKVAWHKVLPQAFYFERLVRELMRSQLRTDTMRREKKHSEMWFLDSASEGFHFTWDLKSLEDLQPQETPKHLWRGYKYHYVTRECVPTAGCGSVVTKSLKIPNVYYVPGIQSNIISASQLCKDHGFSLTFTHNRIYVVDRSSNIVGFAIHNNHKYELEYLHIEKNHASIATGNQDGGLYHALWYRRVKIANTLAMNLCKYLPRFIVNVYLGMEEFTIQPSTYYHCESHINFRVGKISANITAHPYDRSLFYMDSGAGCHVTPYRDLLHAYMEHDNPMFPNQFRGRQLVCADGKILAVHGIGNIDTGEIKLEDVLYVPGMVANLVSVKLIIDQLNRKLQGRGEAAVCFFGSHFIVHIFGAGGAMQNRIGNGTGMGDEIYVLNALQQL